MRILKLWSWLEDTNDFNLILSIIQGFTEKVLNQTRT